MTLSAYEVDFEMTYIDGNGRRVGMSLQQIFLADDDTQAMRNGVDWAVSRVEALADAFSKPAFGAIKISEYTIGSYDGIRKEFATNRGFMPFFECCV